MKELDVSEAGLGFLQSVVNVDPPCDACGSKFFWLMSIDNWEDRVTIKCCECEGVVDTPLGQRMITSATPPDPNRSEVE